MLDTLTRYLAYPFVRYALVVGVLIAISSSLLGVTLVLKRYSYIGDGLSHVAFGAMAVATVLKLSNHLALILPLTVLAAILLLRSGQNAKIKGDAAIAMLSVGALAMGYLLMNIFGTASNLAGEISTTLFGSTTILTLTMQDVILCLILSALVVAMFIVFYHRIFAVTFDETFARAVGIRAGLVDLVHGDDDRHARRLGMMDRLDGLRHHAVVGRNDQNDDVGDLSAARTHGGERLVARGVDESDLTAVDLDDGCADMLGDAAGLGKRDARRTNGVEQRCLAVVDMAHDRDHGRTGLEVFFLVVEGHRVFLFRGDDANLAAHVVGDELDKLIGHALGDRQHLAKQEQAFDDVARGNAEGIGEVADRGALGDLDDAVVKHEIGIDALLDGFLGDAFALLGLALLLAATAAALSFVARRGGDGGAGFGKHLVTLELLDLHGHLRVAIVLGCPGHKLGNLRFEMMFGATSALFAAASAGRIGSSLSASARRGCLLGLSLGVDARLLGFDLGKQGI